MSLGRQTGLTSQSKMQQNGELPSSPFFYLAKAPMRFLIDGYNLIFQAGLQSRHRHSRQLEQARERLIKTIAAHLSESYRGQTTIVFDAKSRPVKDVEDRHVIQGIEVLFSVGYPDADAMLEALIGKDSAAQSLCVVSSDHRVQTAARRRKAMVIDSDQFMQRLESGTWRKTGDADQTDTLVDEVVDDRELLDTDWVAAFSQPTTPAETDHHSESPTAGPPPEIEDSAEWIEIFGRPRDEDRRS